MAPTPTPTAYVIQALRAAGEDPNAAAWAVAGLTPTRFLLGLQLADGSFEWQPNTGSNLLATARVCAHAVGSRLPIHRARAGIVPAATACAPDAGSRSRSDP